MVEIMKMKIGIIGGGKLGTCLGKNFYKKKLLSGITTRSQQHNKTLSKFFQLPMMTNDELVNVCDIIFITVPDNLINQIAQSLCNRDLSGKTFFHCSGAMGLDELSCLREKGGSIGSIHPLQTFSNMDTRLEGVYMAIDGDGRAQETAQELVQMLEGIPFCVPENERALYHATACICSNYVVAIEYLAQELMCRWMPHNNKAAGWEALKPLFKATVNNLAKSKLAQQPLTGPISRGDTNTVAKHLKVLPEDVHTLYQELGKYAVMAALANETITEDTATELKNLLK